MLNILSEQSTYLKALNAQSRNIEHQGNKLAKIHFNIGTVLGQHYLNNLPLKEIAVTNPQGKQGIDMSLDCDNVTIICLMRAGLYLAQGVREIMGDSRHIFCLSSNPSDVPEEYVKGRDVVIVDSVINSGNTLCSYLANIKQANSTSVITLVMQEGFIRKIEEKYQDIPFIVSRVSKNSYVGAGQTDTGNRLFGTF